MRDLFWELEFMCSWALGNKSRKRCCFCCDRTGGNVDLEEAERKQKPVSPPSQSGFLLAHDPSIAFVCGYHCETRLNEQPLHRALQLIIGREEGKSTQCLHFYCVSTCRRSWHRVLQNFMHTCTELEWGEGGDSGGLLWEVSNHVWASGACFLMQISRQTCCLFICKISCNFSWGTLTKNWMGSLGSLILV